MIKINIPIELYKFKITLVELGVMIMGGSTAVTIDDIAEQVHINNYLGSNLLICNNERKPDNPNELVYNEAKDDHLFLGTIPPKTDLFEVELPDINFDLLIRARFAGYHQFEGIFILKGDKLFNIKDGSPIVLRMLIDDFYTETVILKNT